MLNFKKIPQIVLVNTNTNIEKINYPIFLNSKNFKSMFFFLYLIRKTL
jgi:ribosomal protein S2